VRAFVLAADTWSKNTGWGGGLGFVSVSDTVVSPLVLASQVLGAAQFGGAFSLDRLSGTLLGSAPDGGLQSDPGGPSVSASGVVFADGASPAPAIFAVRMDLTDPTRVPLSGAGSISTIALGSAGSRYLLTLDGHLESHLLTLALDWSEGLDATTF